MSAFDVNNIIKLKYLIIIILFAVYAGFMCYTITRSRCYEGFLRDAPLLCIIAFTNKRQMEKFINCSVFIYIYFDFSEPAYIEINDIDYMNLFYTNLRINYHLLFNSCV